MQIICCNIPSQTSCNDLFQFAAHGARSWSNPFVKSSIICCEIMRIYDEENSSSEYHGLITYKLDKVAEQAIKKLDGSAINNREVRVRIYNHRTTADRRYSRNSLTQEVKADKRKHDDRRRRRLQITRHRYTPDGTIYINGVKQ